MKTRILVLDPIAPEGLELLRGDSNFEYKEIHGLKGQELKESLALFDGAIVRSGVKITAESLEGNRKLKAIV